MFMWVVDIVVLCSLGYFFYQGYTQGILRVLIQPLALICGLAFGWYSYAINHNILRALLYCFSVTILLRWIASLILKILNDHPQAPKPSAFSAGSAAAVSVLWGAFLVGQCVVLLGIFPLKIGPLKTISENARSSITFRALSRLIPGIDLLKNVNSEKTQSTLRDPAPNAAFKKWPEYQNLIEDEALQKIFSDEEFNRLLQEKNIPALLNHPKFQELLQNKALLEKFFKFQKRMNE
ncbi:MAG: hypothetical protein HQL23_02940 [Candidatus Omnitrophica bacterium]|nr:hypothetical protein [Candidatus Omnitrophota bacterium]